MKKIIALFLVVLMISCLLIGCGEKSQDGGDNQTATSTKTDGQPQWVPNQNNTQQNKPAAVGDILDAPEVIYTSEKLYVYYTYPAETGDQTLSMELAIDQVTEDTYVIYASDGLLKLNEIIYEVTDTSITKYYKDSFMEGFVKNTELPLAALQKEKDGMMDLVFLFILDSAEYDMCKLRKSDASVFTPTGDSYVYDLILDGTVTGQICVDKATGVVVKCTDSQGTSQFSVQQFKTSGFTIPAYK